MTRGDDDDPQLHAMRAVWRAMPDEDPPARGLAELMAAARTKAETLASPPWWRRLLDLLKRPTVLALASVLVLIGGAVLVTNRPQVASQPTYTHEPDPKMQRQTPPVEDHIGAPAATPTESTVTTPAAAPPPPPPPPPLAAPSHQSPPRRDPRPSPPPPAAHAVDRAPPAEPMPAAGATATPELQTQPTPSAPVSKTAIKADDDETAPEGTRGPRQVLVDELLQQCRTAAKRGDCEAAKLIAKRIAKQDATYYREHVASDPTLSKCAAF